MTVHLRIATTILFILSTIACGGSKSPTAPTTPTTTTTTVPAVTTYTIQGRVTSAAGPAISGATVRIVDSVNAGKSSTTDGNGSYVIAGIAPAGFTLEASASGFVAVGRASPLVAGTATATANFSLLPGTLYSKTGTGDTVFDMPTYITRVSVIGDYGGNSSNFIVYVAGRLFINELIGTGWKQTHFQGTYLTTGGTVEIKSSSGVSWSFVEVR